MRRDFGATGRENSRRTQRRNGREHSEAIFTERNQHRVLAGQRAAVDRQRPGKSIGYPSHAVRPLKHVCRGVVTICVCRCDHVVSIRKRPEFPRRDANSNSDRETAEYNNNNNNNCHYRGVFATRRGS